MEFRTVLLLARTTATGVEVPPEVVAALGSGRKPAVTVTLNGDHRFPSTVASLGGKFLAPVSAEHRAAAGLRAGDEVLVDLVLDTAPRVLAVPEDLAAALEAEPASRRRSPTCSHDRRSAAQGRQLHARLLQPSAELGDLGLRNPTRVLENRVDGLAGRGVPEGLHGAGHRLRAHRGGAG